MSSITRGDVYAYNSDREGYVVVDSAEEPRVSLIAGFPRNTVYSPTNSFSNIFKKVLSPQHYCTHKDCTVKTATRTLRGERLCLEHIPDTADFLVDSESYERVLSTLKVVQCPSCSVKDPVTIIDVDYSSPQIRCTSCQQRFIMSGTSNPRMFEILAQCDRGVVFGHGAEFKVQRCANAEIRKAILSKTQFLRSTILKSQDTEAVMQDIFIAINPNIQVKFALNQVHITTYTPNFVLVKDGGVSLKIPYEDFRTVQLDPTNVVASCKKITGETIEGWGTLDGNRLFEIDTKSPNHKDYSGVSFETRRVNFGLEKVELSLNFLRLFSYQERGPVAWDDLR